MASLVLYDGVCGLCNSTVLWLLRIDRRRVLTFAPLQGETAKQISLPPKASDTIVHISGFRSENEKVWVRSDAILEILRTVGGFWKVAPIFRIIPRPVRDAVYDWIARNRSHWFDKYEVCRVPPFEVRDRFLP